MNKDLSIYIHIPFCYLKCFYCDFCSYDKKEDLIEKYIDSVCAEILENSDLLCARNITTVYIGGGTPSYIDSKYITKIMSLLSMLMVTKPKEITIEVNPNSVDDKKVKEYIEAGINRFSIRTSINS